MPFCLPRTCVCVPSFLPAAHCVPGGRCPGITFLHEGVAYDTSSGLGQTSPDPTFNTPPWSPQSPLVPFSALTTSPPLLRWTQSRPHHVFSYAPATAGFSLQRIGTFDLFGSALMLHRGVGVPWQSLLHRLESNYCDRMLKNCPLNWQRVKKGLCYFNLWHG